MMPACCLSRMRAASVAKPMRPEVSMLGVSLMLTLPAAWPRPHAVCCTQAAGQSFVAIPRRRPRVTRWPPPASHADLGLASALLHGVGRGCRGNQQANMLGQGRVAAPQRSSLVEMVICQGIQRADVWILAAIPCPAGGVRGKRGEKGEKGVRRVRRLWGETLLLSRGFY